MRDQTLRPFVTPPIEDVPPSLQDDGIVRNPAASCNRQLQAASGFADAAFARNQNADAGHTDQHAVEMHSPVSHLGEQSHQTALQQPGIEAGGKNGCFRLNGKPL